MSSLSSSEEVLSGTGFHTTLSSAEEVLNGTGSHTKLWPRVSKCPGVLESHTLLRDLSPAHDGGGGAVGGGGGGGGGG